MKSPETFHVKENEFLVGKELNKVVCIRFNPYIEEEMNKAWELNNSYTSQGFEHKQTVDHQDGYTQVMLLMKNEEAK